MERRYSEGMVVGGLFWDGKEFGGSLSGCTMDFGEGVYMVKVLEWSMVFSLSGRKCTKIQGSPYTEATYEELVLIFHDAEEV